MKQDNTLAQICAVIQRGRIKPAKYKHYLKIPINIYYRLQENGVIVPEYFFIEQSAFFEYNEKDVTISFINLCTVDDMHIRILSFLVSEQYGKNPIERGGVIF